MPLNVTEQMRQEWNRFRRGLLKNFIRSYEQQKPNQTQVPPHPRNTPEAPKEEPPSEPKNDPSQTPVQDPPLNL